MYKYTLVYKCNKYNVQLKIWSKENIDYLQF